MLSSFNTTLHADSIERCPSRPGMFVCGTYQLLAGEGAPRVRQGLLHWVDADASAALAPLQTLPCGGILDLKWGTHASSATLACAESEAGFHLVRLGDDAQLQVAVAAKLCRARSSMLTRVEDWAAADNSLINLSVDWTADQQVLVSHSDGSLSQWSDSQQCVRWWDAHDNEAWIVAAHRSVAHEAWSGSDDCRLRGWDLRSARATFTRAFDVGVTSIANSVHDSHLWAVGSYDERVYVFDARSTKAPLSRSGKDELGGGVWRVKWHPRERHLLALACMRSGFHVMALGGHGATMHHRRHYQPHESEALAYGVDWISGDRIACCSFYDSTCSTFAPTATELAALN